MRFVRADLSKEVGQDGEVQVVKIVSVGEPLPTAAEDLADSPAGDVDVAEWDASDLEPAVQTPTSVPDPADAMTGVEEDEVDDGKSGAAAAATDVVVGRAGRGKSRKSSERIAKPPPAPCLCPICGRMFRSVKLHMKLHRQPSFECPDCGRLFARRDYMTEHRRIHSDDRPYLCVDCGHSFATAGTLRVHRRSHSDERRYRCDQCGKGFRRSSHRNEHVRCVHEGVRPYRCPRCPRAFSTSNGLKMHTMSHTDERPHACPLCPKRFKTRLMVDLHQSTHTGERRYPCTVCGRRFTQRSAAVNHERTQHSVDGGRWHQCELCGQTFNKRSIRDAHVRRHLGDKPYACPACAWSFAFAGDLRNHMIKKHKVKRYPSAGRPMKQLPAAEEP